jgi:hypothetical protein
MPPTDFLAELGWRGLAKEQSQGLAARMERGPISGYIGFDASATSLHVGHLLQVFLLTHLQRSGGRPVVVIGGATGMIGDPSGKAGERRLLDDDTIRANAAAMRGQLERFGGREVDTAGDGFLATSTALRGRSAAPSPAGTSWRRRASRSKPDSTPGSVSWSATRSGESRSTLELGSLRWQLRARFSYQARSRISSRARAWSSKSVERISYVACQVNGACLRLSCEPALEDGRCSQLAPPTWRSQHRPP